MAEIKLLTCRIGSRDLSDNILRPANKLQNELCVPIVGVGASSKSV
jgi:hypothetical protein